MFQEQYSSIIWIVPKVTNLCFSNRLSNKFFQDEVYLKSNNDS